MSKLKKYDAGEMYKIYDMWPEIAKTSYNSITEQLDLKNIDHVVLSGMGGSGTICDIFSAILSKSNMHVYVNKGYVLPKNIHSNTLVVAVSVSGNTAETLSVLQSAKNLNCKIAAFSSGGKMGQYCIKNNIIFRKLAQYHSPRASLLSFLYPMLNFLGSVFMINKNDVLESLEIIQKLQKQISSMNLDGHNPSLDLAQWITKIPIIYYPAGLQAAAIRFKNSLHENAKTHAMVEDIVEASHNSIVSWESQSDVQPILIQGQDDYVKTKERWTIIKEYFDTHDIKFYEIFSTNGNILSKIIHLTYMLDYATIYKAVLSQIDPTPIDSLNYIKNRLEK